MHITVFCSASDQVPNHYKEMAFELGKQLAKRGHTLIYGGGKVGLMGLVANGVLSKGGNVIGVIPETLMAREVAHLGLTELIVVNNMHQRKMKMHELSHATITIPGGFGTLDEWVEIMTWKQLGLHEQPIAICNYSGFFNHLFAQIEQMEKEGFLHSMHMKDLLIDEDFSTLLDKIEEHIKN